jgi:hypothetical protein
VALDLPHIPEPTRSEITKELELRLLDPIFESLKHGQRLRKGEISSHKPGLCSMRLHTVERLDFELLRD